MEQYSIALVEKAATWGAQIVGVLVALFVAWVVAAWVRRTIIHRLEQRNFDQTLTR